MGLVSGKNINIEIKKVKICFYQICQENSKEFLNEAKRLKCLCNFRRVKKSQYGSCTYDEAIRKALVKKFQYVKYVKALQESFRVNMVQECE